jgi:hypothetical protein
MRFIFVAFAMKGVGGADIGQANVSKPIIFELIFAALQHTR